MRGARLSRRVAVAAGGLRGMAAGMPAKEKGPGSAFGPESVPLATGLVSVVYWVPGPFPGPTPRPARRAAAPFGATPSREGGWMLAPSTMT
jgi:hypothetical protein